METGQHANHGALVWLAVVPVALLCGYLWALHRQRRPRQWSRWRTACFGTGCALLVAALTPPIATWGHHDLRGHMVQHLLLGMYAPLALALGAPGTLLLRTASVAVGRRLVALLAWRPLRFLIHPLTALVLDIGGMYLLYLTPLYSLSQGSPAALLFLHLHFMVSGYIFSWSVAGPDPAPHRPGMKVRLAALFLATAAHANLGKLMYGYGFPRHTAAEPETIAAAAELMYYGGDIAELLLTIAFFAAWFRLRAAPLRAQPA